MTAPSNRKRIGLIVDHPLRDLPGMVLLAHELTSLGAEAVLVPLYAQGIDVPLLQLDAVVLNFARQINMPLARTYRDLGLAVYVLDTEGGVMSETGRVSPAQIAQYVRDSGFAALLEGYFFWGSALRDAFVAADVLPENKLHLTGCPRFDYYTSRYAHMETPKRTDHVLVNTNFPAVNPRFAANGDNDLAALRSVGMEESYILQLRDDNLRVMAGMLDLVGKLARDMPAREFVVRPHPFERHEAYHEAFGTLPNVSVDPDGPVLDALRGAHAVLHLNCSTAIEALMLGIAPVSPEWINTDFLRGHAPLPSRASRSVADYGSMLELLDSPDPARGFAMQETYDSLAAPFFHTNDGHAAARVANILIERSSPADRPSLHFGASIRASRAGATIMQRLQGLGGNIAGTQTMLKLRARLQKKRSAKGFGIAEIATLLGKIAASTGTEMQRVDAVRHPFTRTALSSIVIAPADPS